MWNPKAKLTCGSGISIRYFLPIFYSNTPLSNLHYDLLIFNLFHVHQYKDFFLTLHKQPKQEQINIVPRGWRKSVYIHARLGGYFLLASTIITTTLTERIDTNLYETKSQEPLFTNSWGWADGVSRIGLGWFGRPDWESSVIDFLQRHSCLALLLA